MIVEHRGWEIVRLRSGDVEIDVVPDKGGDITAVRYHGTNLLWESPWGLRPRGEPEQGATSAERWLEMYPGGWQTIFPNGGDESEGHSFHGEACLVPYEYNARDAVVDLRTTLDGFDINRRIDVRADGLDVSETIRNTSSEPRDAMWSHHPAFGAPLISGSTRVECGATSFVVDDLRDVEHGDLPPGAVSDWPFSGSADLRILPPDGEPLDRFGYCTGFTDGWATITNDELTVRLGWDPSLFPCAWYWLEARATTGAPWFGEAYVFAIEPATTWPGQGLANARRKGNGPIRFEPGEEKRARVTLTLERPHSDYPAQNPGPEHRPPDH